MLDILSKLEINFGIFVYQIWVGKSVQGK